MSVRFAVQRVPPNHFAWMVERNGVTLTSDFDAVAVVDPSRHERCRYCQQEHAAIRGMVGYSDVTPASAYLHIALDTPAAYRSLRKVALPLLFEVANREVALAQVRASNARVRRLLEHECFQQVAVLPGAYKSDDDLVIYRLDRADWRATHGGEG